MSEQVYLQYIKSRVSENLNVIYTSKSDVISRDFKHAAATIIATQYIIDSMANNLRIWSYNQAKQAIVNPTPDMARTFLTTELVRRYTLTCVQQFSQLTQQNNITQTR